MEVQYVRGKHEMFTITIRIIALLWLLCGVSHTTGVIVSPDSGYRNSTNKFLFLRNLNASRIPIVFIRANPVIKTEKLTTTEQTPLTSSSAVTPTKAIPVPITATDRNRRLIPYMTFYVPQDNGQQLDYSEENLQAKRLIALYPAIHKIQQQEQIDTGQMRTYGDSQFLNIQPSGEEERRPIVYGSTNQILSSQNQQQYNSDESASGGTNSNNNNNEQINVQQYQFTISQESPRIHHLPPAPISFKNSNIKPNHMQPTVKTNLTPFTPENKLPGGFTPIMPANYEIERKPVSVSNNLQHADDDGDRANADEGFKPSLGYGNDDATSPRPSQHLVESSSLVFKEKPRFLRPLLSNQQQDPSVQRIPIFIPQEFNIQQGQTLTPQQKYVNYLQGQLRIKHQQHYLQQQQQQQQQQQIQTSEYPQSGPGQYGVRSKPLNIHIVSSTPLPPPDNYLQYQQENSDEQVATESPFIYLPPSPKGGQLHNQEDSPSQQSTPSPLQTYKGSTPTAPSRVLNYAKFIVLPEVINQAASNKPNNEKPSFTHHQFVTTPVPLIVTPIVPLLKPTIVPVPVQRLKPILPPTRLTIPNREYQQESQKDILIPVKIPSIFVTKASTTPAPIRQHLTETTQVPIPPKLTTYHPEFVSSKPTEAPPVVDEQQKQISYPRLQQKIKPAFKYRPIIVTEPISQAPSSSSPYYPMLNSGKQQPVKYSLGNRNLPTLDSIANAGSLADILTKLQDSNQLPHTLTPENIDNSIRTLIKILNHLKQSQTIADDPNQHHEDYDEQQQQQYEDLPPSPSPLPPIQLPKKPHKVNSRPGPNSGRPGIDYPVLSEIPKTSFNCKEQRYKGFFGDPETNCQVWHYCDLNGGQASFLCPNGTIFSQVALTCDWWFNVKCSSTAQLYVLNERLYKYILPFTPKFPEDYTGPLVDKYLALKFQEMEEKMRREKTKGKNKSSGSGETEDEDESSNDGSTTEEDDVPYNDHELSVLQQQHLHPNQQDGKFDENYNVIGSSTEGGIEHEVNSYTYSTTPATSSSSQTSSFTSSSTPSVYSDSSFYSMPIVVSSTDSPLQGSYITTKGATLLQPQQQSTTINTNGAIASEQENSSSPKISIERQKIELVEIKSDGSSGHLTPTRIGGSNSGLK